jgi:hypothetical protein
MFDVFWCCFIYTGSHAKNEAKSIKMHEKHVIWWNLVQKSGLRIII